MNARATLFGALALSLAATGASAQITGSAHDFTQYAWNTTGEICKPCHIPHGGNWQAGKLWNHQMSDPATQYNLYGSGTTGVTSDGTAFDSTSKLCLSCHDGTVALDSFGGATGTTFLTPADPEYIGTDLRNDHPIGSKAIYDTTGTSTSFHPQNASHQVVSAAGTLRLRSWTDPADNTAKYVVGCKTCHNPHRTPGADHLLAFSNANSQLCLTCHIK
jgi:predicted CXXCH cytochrome family protein